MFPTPVYALFSPPNEPEIVGLYVALPWLLTTVVLPSPSTTSFYLFNPAIVLSILLIHLRGTLTFGPGLCPADFEAMPCSLEALTSSVLVVLVLPYIRPVRSCVCHCARHLLLASVV